MNQSIVIFIRPSIIHYPSTSHSSSTPPLSIHPPTHYSSSTTHHSTSTPTMHHPSTGHSSSTPAIQYPSTHHHSSFTNPSLPSHPPRFTATHPLLIIHSFILYHPLSQRLFIHPLFIFAFYLYVCLLLFYTHVRPPDKRSVRCQYIHPSSDRRYIRKTVLKINTYKDNS